jgi:tRNA threonylcarbamoyladenosine biosynthesis protein TsaB
VRHAVGCLDARMGEVYWSRYVRGADGGLRATHAPAVGAPASVWIPADVAHLGAGRGFSAHPDLQRLPGLCVTAAASRALPHARAIAALGALGFACGAGVAAAELAPLYVRDNVALTTAERRAPAPRPSEG